LELGPLDAETVRAIVDSARENAGDAFDSILRESHGNPFFLGELLRARRGCGDVHTLSLSEALDSHIGRLPVDHRVYLDLVAVAARPISDTLMQRVLDYSFPAVRETRRALVAESLVRMAENQSSAVEPYHDRIRQHLLSRLSPERRRALRRALAEACGGARSGREVGRANA
jgi:hypothetical protein